MKSSKIRYFQILLRILDSKEENDIEISNNAPKIQNNISDEAEEKF